MSQKDVGNKIPIYKLKTTEEVMGFYDDWGDKDKNNKDMVDWNYTGPKETVNVFKKYAEKKRPINAIINNGVTARIRAKIAVINPKIKNNFFI